jgi:hypothetical protein
MTGLFSYPRGNNSAGMVITHKNLNDRFFLAKGKQSNDSISPQSNSFHQD